MTFPMPNERIQGEGIVIASTHYGDHDDLATILVLRPVAPFYRVGVWNHEMNEWDGGYYEDCHNIVPAVNGQNGGLIKSKHKIGYQGMGGDY